MEKFKSLFTGALVDSLNCQRPHNNNDNNSKFVIFFGMKGLAWISTVFMAFPILPQSCHNLTRIPISNSKIWTL